LPLQHAGGIQKIDRLVSLSQDGDVWKDEQMEVKEYDGADDEESSQPMISFHTHRPLHPTALVKRHEL
jgi:hypothetical protein